MCIADVRGDALPEIRLSSQVADVDGYRPSGKQATGPLMLKQTFAAASIILASFAHPAYSEPVANDTARSISFDHMSINVADFDAAVEWYTTKLGFEVDVAWRVEPLDGKRLAYLSLGDAVIELVAADQGGIGLPAATSFPDHFGRTGYGHLCFEVVDVDGMLSSLEALGVPTFVAGETYPLEGTVYERRVGFIQDPEGNVIEFAEPLSRRM
ncbi:MAG: VOC family protein [Pseudomonadota bacterium]